MRCKQGWDTDSHHASARICLTPQFWISAEAAQRDLSLGSTCPLPVPRSLGIVTESEVFDNPFSLFRGEIAVGAGCGLDHI